MTTKKKAGKESGVSPVVLVVEDHDEERDSIRDQLVAFGFSVQTAKDLESARRRLKGRYYSGVVLDYRIPPFVPRGEEESGGVLLREIRKQDAFVPIVVLSAVVQPDQEGALVEDEVTFILHKAGSKPEALPQVMKRLTKQGEFIGSLLAEWVEDNPEANAKVLAGPDGKKYSLREALREMKRDTPLGRALRSNLLKGLLEVYVRT